MKRQVIQAFLGSTYGTKYFCKGIEATSRNTDSTAVTGFRENMMQSVLRQAPHSRPQKWEVFAVGEQTRTNQLLTKNKKKGAALLNASHFLSNEMAEIYLY